MFLSLPTHTPGLLFPQHHPHMCVMKLIKADGTVIGCTCMHACVGKGDREKQIAAMENGVPAIAPIDLSDSFNDSGLLNTDTHRSVCVCVCAGKI